MFSGIQPTGDFHVGSYVGALRTGSPFRTTTKPSTAWSISRDDRSLRRRGQQDEPGESARMLLAVGVDPERSLLYYQSEVPQHVELAWISARSPGSGSWSG